MPVGSSLILRSRPEPALKSNMWRDGATELCWELNELFSTEDAAACDDVIGKDIGGRLRCCENKIMNKIQTNNKSIPISYNSTNSHRSELVRYIFNKSLRFIFWSTLGWVLVGNLGSVEVLLSDFQVGFGSSAVCFSNRSDPCESPLIGFGAVSGYMFTNL